jgi:enolase
MRTGIARIEAREVLDSRGQPTVEVDVILSGGARGRALVPSGASTGQHEALELRDRDARFRGKGVRRAVEHAQGALAHAVVGRDAADLAAVDEALKAADGTPNLRMLGANAVLGVSLATAHAAAAGLGEPLYRFVNRAFGGGAMRLPVPLLNVLNGGAHADNGLDIQEVMIAPTGFATFAEALRAGAEVYQALKQDLHDAGLSTAVGDEGGFAPRVATCEEAIERVEQAVRSAGYRPGEEIRLALDAAATEFHESQGEHGGRYRLEGRERTAQEAVDLYARWVERHPIYSLEDGLAEDDWAGWKLLTARLGARMQLVGDDLFVTNTERLARGLREGVANAVLVKPNQIGTLTDTLACVRAAYAGGYGVVMSHRSGETEDTTIADLAVALGTGQIKTGAPCRGERTAKYNRLLRIEAELAQEHGGPVPFGLRALVPPPVPQGGSPGGKRGVGT